MIDQEVLAELVAKTMDYIDENYAEGELTSAAIVFEVHFEDEDGDGASSVHVEAPGDQGHTTTFGLLHRGIIAMEGRERA